MLQQQYKVYIKSKQYESKHLQQLKEIYLYYLSRAPTVAHNKDGYKMTQLRLAHAIPPGLGCNLTSLLLARPTVLLHCSYLLFLETIYNVWVW